MRMKFTPASFNSANASFLSGVLPPGGGGNENEKTKVFFPSICKTPFSSSVTLVPALVTVATPTMKHAVRSERIHCRCISRIVANRFGCGFDCPYALHTFLQANGK